MTDLAPPEAVRDDGMQPLVEELASEPGVILFVGMSDVGKTTLVGRVARAAIARGTAVAIVDSDVGQSNIGPPAAIGMKLFRESMPIFRVRRADKLAFVGATQPAGFFLDMVSGVNSLVRAAQDAGAGLVLVDSSGVGPTLGGLRLKEEKFLRLRPDRLVLLEQRRELHLLAQVAQACAFSTVHRVRPSPLAHLKPSSFRKGFRKRMLEEYFHGARQQRLELKGVGVRGCSLLAGRPLAAAARVRVAEFLKAPVLRAELGANRLTVITARKAHPDGVGILEQRFPRLQIFIHTPTVLDGLLVGLEDGQGATLDLGIIHSVDFGAGALNLVTPYTDLASVRLVHAGVLRLKPDGSELGSFRPGEV